MTDEPIQPISPQGYPPTPTEAVFQQPKKSNKNIWIIAGITFGILCLCSIICAAVVGVGLFQVYKETAPIQSVLDSYMRYMANKDIEGAYTLFSPRAQRQIPMSELQELVEGNNYILFDGYQSLSVSNLNISAAVNTDPDSPQGTVAKVTGIINYEGDIQGTFNGILEQVNDEWMIHGMYITVPPSKIK